MLLELFVAHRIQICRRECLVSHMLEELLRKRWLPRIPLEELLRKLLLPVFLYIHLVSARGIYKPSAVSLLNWLEFLVTALLAICGSMENVQEMALSLIHI